MDAKEQYIVEVDRKMKEWGSRTDQLRRESEAQRKESELLEDLLRKQEEAQDALEELRQSGADMWEELKATVALRTQDFQDTLVRASERFGAGYPREQGFVMTQEEPSGEKEIVEAGAEAPNADEGPPSRSA